MGLKEHYSMKEPCPTCPFRKGTELERGMSLCQLKEIVTDPEGYICPRTVELLRGSVSMTDMDKERECAGWLIWHLKRKEKFYPFPSTMSLAANLNFVKADTLLEHADEVHHSFEELFTMHLDLNRNEEPQGERNDATDNR